MSTEEFKAQRAVYAKKYRLTETYKAGQKRHYSKHKERIKARGREYRIVHRDELRERERLTRVSQILVLAERRVMKYAELKEAAINNYSNGDACCLLCSQADIDILCLDHIKDDGADRRRTGSVYEKNHLYRWLCANQYPPGFQVLCANCNLKKAITQRREARKIWMNNV